jgi:lipopolysaccharide export system protein LptA
LRRLRIFVAWFVTVLLSAESIAQIDLPPSMAGDPISASADAAYHWSQGAYDVWLLQGHAQIKQGGNVCRSDEAVLWIKRAEAPLDAQPAAKIDAPADRARPPGTERRTREEPNPDELHKVIAYLEGNVRIDCSRVRHPQTRPLSEGNTAPWFGRFYSTVPVAVEAGRVARGAPQALPGVYERGVARRSPPSNIQRTQFTQPAAPPAPPAFEALPSGTRRLRFFERYKDGFHVDSQVDPVTRERVAVITGGIELLLDDTGPTGQLDIAADKLVLWTTGGADPERAHDTLEHDDVPLEVYMEGNVVFRQGDRIVYADRMYFDVVTKNGTIVSAEVLTPAMAFGGLLRLKSQLIRIRNGDEMYARKSYVTSSRFALPGYRVQSQEMFLEDRQTKMFDPKTGEPVIDPETGDQMIEHDQIVTAKNNLFFLGPVPVFYWPRFRTRVDEPSTLLVGAFFQQDRIYGFWSEAEFDAFELLGLERLTGLKEMPKGTDWTFTGSYLSQRGAGGGTWFKIDRTDLFGVQGPAYGVLDVWGLHDKGFDNLGRGRNHLAPENPSIRDRGRALGNFRWTLPEKFQLTAEVGYISDRNFLEQYYEYEWDQQKDSTTDLMLKRTVDNRSWSVNTDVRVNPFFTDTNWLPRGDHFLLGRSLLGGLTGDRLTYYEHSSAGYAQNKITDFPTDAQDLANFQLLPWELFGNHQGSRLDTKHEIDAPFDLGPFKFVPHVTGELTHWDEDLSGNPVNRAWGQVGIRGSIPFWKVYPNVESELFNVHGIAHKAVLSGDLSYADTNVRMTSLPLYDALDDNAQELFRRRFVSFDFGGILPPQLESRYYAIRAGLQDSVTNPTTEIAERLGAARFGLLQRWQTKRGPPGRRRIIDWIVLDVNAVYFPNKSQDFGQTFGLVDYNFRWHVGDRVTIVSDGGYDFFSQGQRTFTIGATLQRSPRVNWFIGYNSLNGPFTYNVVTFSHSYQMSPKWLYSASTSFALQSPSNIGQSVGISRIGESFVTNFSFYADSSKNNIGFNFMMSPRFLGPRMLTKIGAAAVPIAGANGLE